VRAPHVDVASDLTWGEQRHYGERTAVPLECVEHAQVRLIVAVANDGEVDGLDPEIAADEERERLLVWQAVAEGDRFAGEEDGRAGGVGEIVRRGGAIGQVVRPGK
jgi:hypothetical protein